jgi:hypothetical protein
LRPAGIRASPCPQPTQAIGDETVRMSCSMRGEKPLAWHTAKMLSK